jgi:alkylation response protein AidB-like acyl-CoA dehydrogenase
MTDNPGRDGGLGRDGGSPGWQMTGEAFRVAVESGRLDLPFPGSGRTRERWAAFAELAAADLSLARLGEGHSDALAILAELDGPAPPPGSRWGVWAAHPPGPALEARGSGGRWNLRGTKRYCSGARSCTHALVTATAPDGERLFVVEVRAAAPIPGTWPATGMAASDTLDVGFCDVPAEPVGPPGAYVERPGFAHGGVGVAACWYGGTRAVGRTLLTAASERDVGPHALAHLGAVDIALNTVRAALDGAADEIDADPADVKAAGRIRALRVRALAEAAATDVMNRVGRALGAGPLCLDEPHSRRVADLTVYVRQHHAERNLAELGALVAGQGTQW